jgi:hypothetical protein
MEKTVRKLVEDIVADGSCVLTQDAGNGSGGPMSLSTTDLQELINDDSVDDYDVLDEDGDVWDGRCTVAEMISDILNSNGVTDSDTQWILAERVEWTDGCQNNPYRHYLLLWEV